MLNREEFGDDLELIDKGLARRIFHNAWHKNYTGVIEGYFAINHTRWSIWTLIKENPDPDIDGGEQHGTEVDFKYFSPWECVDINESLL